MSTADSGSVPMSDKPHGLRSEEILPPPFAWVEIPAGRVADERYEMIDVPAFAISKYPITNAQYAKFIEAGGYREQKWWTDDGWYLRTIERWTEPKHWQDKKWTAAEHPVDGVSWYESMAFCCWLSEVTGEKILLPTDQQWQWAALGDDGRKYPWGKDWDGTRCNNSVGSQLSMGTTPVRQYEGRGDSPFGVVDMVGNVWEWCLTERLFADSSWYELYGTYYVIRGGSWQISKAYVFRQRYREGNAPRTRVYNNGFRCVRIRAAL